VVWIHLDTDFAGDTDDAAALVMLQGWPDAELVGITTVADPDGQRAGYVHHVLALAGEDDIPVASGAGLSLAGVPMGTPPDHHRYWGDDPVPARPSAPRAAVELLEASVEAGATLVAIGPYTNLALLEARHPGALSQTRIVLMGGWVHPPEDGLPPWGPEMDWNVQCDTQAAQTVFQAARRLDLVTLPATLSAHLRAAHLPRLEASGPLGRLLARQARAHAEDYNMGKLARAHGGLPNDLLNFHYDPVACAVALDWPGTTVEEMRMRPVEPGGVLRFEQHDDGKSVNVVTSVDGDAFAETWLRAVATADRRGR
jgi:inosine-uridine nucleoside N-ribohydrolase